MLTQQQQKSSRNSSITHQSPNVKINAKNAQNWREWRQKHAEKDKIAAKMLQADMYKRGERMSHCSDMMIIRTCPQCGKAHIISGGQCRDKLCPICMWRLAIRRYGDMMTVLDTVNTRYPSARYLLLTLTVRNVDMTDLYNTLNSMSQAWHRILRRKFFQTALGCTRSLEITYNDKTQQAHPHYHVLVIMPPSSEATITNFAATVSTIWGKALGASYNPICDIRYIYDRQHTDTTDYSAAVCETYKYMTKSKSLLQMPAALFAEFAAAVNGRRMVSYLGIIKDIRQELSMAMDDDVEPADTDTVISCKSCDVQLQEACYRWATICDLTWDDVISKGV